MSDTHAFTPGTFQDLQPLDARTYTPSHLGTEPLRWLPPAAAERLRQLQQRADDKRNLLPDFEQRREALNEKLAAAQRLKRLLDHPQQGGFGLADDHLSVVVARREAERNAAAHRRLDDLHTVRAADLQAASGALTAVESWLKHGRPAGTTLEQIETEPPKLLKGETVLDAIERLRRRGRELKADLARIAAAPFPSSYCKQKMREQIAALSDRGTPDVSMLVEHAGEIAFPTMRLRSQVFNAELPSQAFTETADAVALFAWTFKEALIAALDREIEAESDDESAMTHEARQISSSEIQADQLALEFDEAALVFAAQSQGLPCEHRPDVDPCALLGVRLITMPHPTALPGTSPELAVSYIGPG